MMLNYMHIICFEKRKKHSYIQTNSKYRNIDNDLQKPHNKDKKKREKWREIDEKCMQCVTTSDT